jgi:hypothetical protein
VYSAQLRNEFTNTGSGPKTAGGGHCEDRRVGGPERHAGGVALQIATTDGNDVQGRSATRADRDHMRSAIAFNPLVKTKD